MIKSVNNYPVSQLFDIYSGVIYTIPRYQREYIWKKEQWESLFDDIEENDKGYYLGSIICINQSTDALSVQELELVDGQQRLTTLSLLFAAIYQALKAQESNLNEDQLVELANLKHKIFLKKREGQIRVVPQIQNNNQNDYRAVLAEAGLMKVLTIPSHMKLRRIFKAYRYFLDRIDKMIRDQVDQLECIMSFLDKVNQACLVKIEVGNHADAYILFESLNDRGTPLTSIDLIKNKLLATLESKEPGKIDHHYDHWNLLLDYLGDDYSVQERFFRQYYNAFKDELREVGQLPMATRSNLIHIYERLISHNAKEFLVQICSAGKTYALFLSRNQEDMPDILKGLFKDLERIQGAPCYLLMLHLMARKTELQLVDMQLGKILALLVKFFVRRNLTDMPPTRDLIRLFMDIVTSLSGLRGEDLVRRIQQLLIQVSASDAVFQSKLEGPIYEENSGVTRFILFSLEEQGMTKESQIDLWREENKLSVYTIEHILPQAENIPKEWIEMIAGGDAKKAKDIQQNFVHKLGNLTISGFNSTLGPKSFQDKRDRLDRQNRPVGYKNGLKLNEDLAQAESWGQGQIERRTAKLVSQAMSLFKLD